jgi:hypothetical protein
MTSQLSLPQVNEAVSFFQPRKGYNSCLISDQVHLDTVGIFRGGMMNNKTFGIVLVVVGVLIVVAIFLSAPLHLASAGFGMKKILGLVVGLVVLVVGLFLGLSKGQTQKPG